MRSDARRMKLFRLSKSIPKIILEKLEPRSRYKQDGSVHFLEAYFNAFSKFLEIISEEGK